MDARHFINLTTSLQQPTRRILETVSFLLNTELSEEQRYDLASLKTVASQTQALLEKILDYARLEAAEVQLENIPFSLRSAIKFALNQFVQINCFIHSSVPDALLGDPGYLRLALINLLENAVKYSPGGPITLQLQLEDGDSSRPQLYVKIQDQGIGMSAERLQEVFEPYFPSQLDYTSPDGGYRLGVATSRQIIQLMGGRIWVESTLGLGTTFYFSIPLQLAVGQSVEQLRETSLDQIKAMVINDDSLERTTLCQDLASWNIAVEQASDVDVALKLLQEGKQAGHPVKLVFIECRTASLDGFVVAENLKSRGLLDGVVLVMMATEGQRGDAARCRALGVAAYLTRPFRPIELWEMIHFAVGLRQAGRGSNTLITRHLLREEDSKYHILMVATPSASVQHLKILLEQQGHQVTNLEPKVVSSLRLDSFDLVLLQIGGREVWALEIATYLHEMKQERKDYIPVIALTSDTSADWHESLRASGVDDCLTGVVAAERVISFIENRVLYSGGFESP